MRISKANENGVVETGLSEVVASHGRSYAAIKFALCEDGLYRFSTSLQYSHGGFSGPIGEDDDGFPTLAAAKAAGLEDLLRRWHKPFESEPESVHEELRIMRAQVEDHSRQPSLF